MNNPIDTTTVRSLLYTKEGQFMGIADIQMTITWISMTAEAITIDNLSMVRKWADAKAPLAKEGEGQ